MAVVSLDYMLLLVVTLLCVRNARSHNEVAAESEVGHVSESLVEDLSVGGLFPETETFSSNQQDDENNLDAQDWDENEDDISTNSQELLLEKELNDAVASIEEEDYEGESMTDHNDGYFGEILDEAASAKSESLPFQDEDDMKNDRPSSEGLYDTQSVAEVEDDGSSCKSQNDIADKKRKKGIFDQLDSLSRKSICSEVARNLEKFRSKGILKSSGNDITFTFKPQSTVDLGKFFFLPDYSKVKIKSISLDCSTTNMTIETREIQQLSLLPNFLALNRIVAVLSVNLKLPRKTLQFTIKGNWKIGNTRVPVVLSYHSNSGTTSVTADAKVHLSELFKKITGLALPIKVSTVLRFKLRGSISSGGLTSFMISSEKQNENFFALYIKNKRSKPVKAIAVEMKQIQLSAVLKSLTNIDLSGAPYFGNLVVPFVGYVYATEKITGQGKKLFGNVSFLKGRNVNVGKGSTVFVQLPFSSELLIVKYEGKNLILRTPNPTLRLQKLLQLVAPSGINFLKSNIPAIPWNQVFKLGIGRITVTSNSVSFSVDFTANLSLEDYLQLSIEEVEVSVQKTKPRIAAKITGNIKIAGVSFKATIAQNKLNKYVLTAFGNHPISLDKTIKAFHAALLPQELNRIARNLPFLKVAIQKPTMSYLLGSKPPQLHIGGTLVGQGYSTDNLDLLLMKYNGKLQAILGFQVPRINFADLMTGVTRFNFRRFSILNQNLPTSLTMSPITTRKVHFSIGKLSSLQIHKGMSIKATLKFPRNCRSDKFCKLAGRLIGFDTALSLVFSFKSSKYYVVTASLPRMELSKGLTLNKAGLEIVGGVSARIGIVGEVKLKKHNLVFAARILVGKKGLTLQLSMANCWRNAFGAPWLDICNLLASIDFAPPTAITGFALGAQVHLGYSSTRLQMKAKAYVGFSLINPIENYYYARFSRVNMNSFLKALRINWRIPAPLASSSFPNGFISSYSALGKELPEVSLSIPKGFRIKATLNIFGLQGHIDLTMDLPRLLDMHIALPPIKIGNFFAMYSSQKTKSSGPILQAKLDLYKRRAAMGASVYLRVFGVNFLTQFKIANDFYSFTFRLKLFNLFLAHVQMSAKYGGGGGGDIRRADFHVLGTFESDLFKAIAGVVNLDIHKLNSAVYNSIAAAKRTLQQYQNYRTQAHSRVRQLYNKMKYWKGKIFYSTAMKSDKGRGNGMASTNFFRRAGRVIRRAVRKPVDTVRRVVRKVNHYAKKVYEAAKRDYNKAQGQLKHWNHQVNKVQNLLNTLQKNSRKVVKLFEYARKHGIGRILTIQRIQFSGSLKSMSTGHFRSRITALILGRKQYIDSATINVRNLKSIGAQLFRLVVSRF